MFKDLPALDKNGKDNLIDSTQDDDVESDEDVMQSGVKTSFKDLLVVKDYLRHKPEQVKKSLRTFKLWAPLFGGNLPYSSSNSARIPTA